MSNEHLEAIRALIAEVEREHQDQLSVEFTCCGSQEYWPLNANGALEMTHAEMGGSCDSGANEREALAAQVERLQALADAQDRFTTAVVDLLTDAQVESDEYPHDLDVLATRLGRVCVAHGDLSADASPDALSATEPHERGAEDA